MHDLGYYWAASSTNWTLWVIANWIFSSKSSYSGDMMQCLGLWKSQSTWVFSQRKPQLFSAMFDSWINWSVVFSFTHFCLIYWQKWKVMNNYSVSSFEKISVFREVSHVNFMRQCLHWKDGQSAVTKGDSSTNHRRAAFRVDEYLTWSFPAQSQKTPGVFFGKRSSRVGLISYFVFSKFDGLVLKTLRFLSLGKWLLRLFHEVRFEDVDNFEVVFACRVTRVHVGTSPFI